MRGLDGFCPVELVDNEQWIAGRMEYRMTYQGQVFQFSTKAAMRRFAAAPRSMLPPWARDPVLALKEDRSVRGSVQHSAVWQGRLYLFASSANLAAFRRDPQRYACGPHVAERPQPTQPQPTRLQVPADSL